MALPLVISSHQSYYKIINSQRKLVGFWSFLVRSTNTFQSNLFLWCSWELWTICYCQLLRVWIYLIIFLTPSSVLSFQRQYQHWERRCLSYELPWRTALIPLLRKCIANKSLLASPIHTPLGLCWLSLTPLRQAAWTERDWLSCGLPQSRHHLHM